MISLVGLFAGVAMSNYSVNEQQAMAVIQTKEMADIQRAFRRFYNDCSPTNDDLEQIAIFGLWSLFQADNPRGNSPSWPESFDYNRGKGWRGPYMIHEGVKRIDRRNNSKHNFGQLETSGNRTVEIPVLTTPDGGYYRVLVPRFGNTLLYRKIVVVDPGPDGVLDTSNTISDRDTDIVANGDDSVLRLLPGMQ